MATHPINNKVQRIYHPACGKSFYYALVRKKHRKEVTDGNGNKSVVVVKVYMCRNCAEEFSDLDIMEYEANKPVTVLTDMTPEQRKEFINNLFKKDANGRPS